MYGDRTGKRFRGTLQEGFVVQEWLYLIVFVILLMVVLLACV